MILHRNPKDETGVKKEITNTNTKVLKRVVLQSHAADFADSGRAADGRQFDQFSARLETSNLLRPVHLGAWWCPLRGAMQRGFGFRHQVPPEAVHPLQSPKE